jgi:hypothetical protein
MEIDLLLTELAAVRAHNRDLQDRLVAAYRERPHCQTHGRTLATLRDTMDQLAGQFQRQIAEHRDLAALNARARLNVIDMLTAAIEAMRLAAPEVVARELGL